MRAGALFGWGKQAEGQMPRLSNRILLSPLARALCQLRRGRRLVVSPAASNMAWRITRFRRRLSLGRTLGVPLVLACSAVGRL